MAGAWVALCSCWRLGLPLAGLGAGIGLGGFECFDDVSGDTAAIGHVEVVAARPLSDSLSLLAAG
jgi:hypothetical protein